MLQSRDTRRLFGRDELSPAEQYTRIWQARDADEISDADGHSLMGEYDLWDIPVAALAEDFLLIDETGGLCPPYPGMAPRTDESPLPIHHRNTTMESKYKITNTRAAT